MIDKEKVIKGLECYATMCETGSRIACKDCPYFMDCNPSQMMRGAIELLNEQEPRVITLKEVLDFIMADKEMSEDDEIEFNERKPLYVEFREWNDMCYEHWRSPWYLRSWYAADKELFVFNYGKNRRYWTDRPTEEQTKAVLWDE